MTRGKQDTWRPITVLRVRLDTKIVRATNSSVPPAILLDKLRISKRIGRIPGQCNFGKVLRRYKLPLWLQPRFPEILFGILIRELRLRMAIRTRYHVLIALRYSSVFDSAKARHKGSKSNSRPTRARVPYM